ncbi:MAG: hypothetical protein LBS36_10000 [Oscillospiraceae bacterium]|jgi:hypothetical protein|nr:hypothetical protein [Oscillospiraceae bacterium]
MHNETQAPLVHFKLLAIIADRDKIGKLSEILLDMHVKLYYTCHVRGSANSDILDMFGLADSEKSLALCLEQEGKIPAVMSTVSQQLQLHRHGNGIAFSLSLTGICRPIATALESDGWELQDVKELCDVPSRDKAQESMKHDLILAVVNQGFSEELMDIARPAGARGGTVINARRVAGDAVKFFGISVQEEREIVAIITQRATKKSIMQAIIRSFGMQSAARGVVFSLPVDDIAGLH